jgi:hypothetical protein
VGGTNAQLNPFLSSEWNKCSNGIICHRLDLPHVLQESGSSRRKTDIASNAIEESNAQTLFERLDLRSHGRLGEMELIRSPPEVQRIRDYTEDLQLKIFHHGVSPI